jgi:hypothetical protein
MKVMLINDVDDDKIQITLNNIHIHHISNNSYKVTKISKLFLGIVDG